MKIAFGLKAHSGWAALVVLGRHDEELAVVERRRLALVDERDGAWAKQPYHAAEKLAPAAARDLVKRGVEAAHRQALKEMRSAVKRATEGGHDIVGCAVLVVDPMPDWSVDEILAVHFRMHKAEGVLFREALSRAAATCGLRLVRAPEKTLVEHVGAALATTPGVLSTRLARLGKAVGPPWGKDQKEAALAAMIPLKTKPG